MFEEKRKNKRISLSLPTYYEPLETDRKVHLNTVSKDISEGGIRLAFSKFYPPKTKFLLKITLEGINKVIEPLAEIVWSFNTQFSNSYYSGLRFLEMAPSQQETLREYIEIREITKT
jgi:c-di-GMP-binding flagellar brake protein YcgR